MLCDTVTSIWIVIKGRGREDTFLELQLWDSNSLLYMVWMREKVCCEPFARHYFQTCICSGASILKSEFAVSFSPTRDLNVHECMHTGADTHNINISLFFPGDLLIPLYAQRCIIIFSGKDPVHSCLTPFFSPKGRPIPQQNPDS